MKVFSEHIQIEQNIYIYIYIYIYKIIFSRSSFKTQYQKKKKTEIAMIKILSTKDEIWTFSYWFYIQEVTPLDL